MQEVPRLFSFWISLLPQTLEKGVCFDVFSTQQHVRCGQSDGEERGDLDFFHHF